MDEEEKKNSVDYNGEALKGIRNEDLYPKEEQQDEQAILKNFNDQVDAIEGLRQQGIDPFAYDKNWMSKTAIEPSYTKSSDVVSNDFGTSKYDETLYNAQDWSENEQRFDKQSGLTQVGMGVAKLANTAVNTFIGGLYNFFIGVPKGSINFVKVLTTSEEDDNVIKNAFSEFAGSFSEDPINKKLSEERDWLDEVMPQYRSYNQQNNSLWDPRNLFSTNAVADLLNNIGFTIGALYSGIGVAGALGKISSALRAGTSTGVKVLQALSGALGEGCVEGVSTTKDWVTEHSNLIRQNAEGRLRDLDANFENERQKFYAELPNLSEEEAVKRNNEFTNFKNRYQAERYLVEQDMAASLNKIIDEGNDVGRMTLALNIPILTMGHFVIFGRAYQGGFNTLRSEMPSKLTKEAEEFATRFVESKASSYGRALTQSERNDFFSAALKRFGQNGGKVYEETRKVGGLERLGNVVIKPLYEGSEELAQKAASNFAGSYNVLDVDEYYMNRWNPDAIDKTRSKLKEGFQSVIDTIKDPESWYEFAVGALCGGMGSPMFRSMTKDVVVGFERDENGVLRQKVEKQQQFPIYLAGGILEEWKASTENNKKYNEVGKALNDYINSGKLDAAINSLISQTYYSDQMKAHLENGNKFDWKNAELREFLTSVEHFANAGRLADLKGIISSFNVTANSDAALENIKKMTTSTDPVAGEIGPYKDCDLSTKDGKEEMRKRIKKHTNEMINTVDTYSKVRKDINTTSGGRLSANQLACLTWYKVHLQDWTRRSKELLSGKDSEGNEIPITDNIKNVREVLKIAKDNIKLAMTEKSLQFDEMLDPKNILKLDERTRDLVNSIAKLEKSTNKEDVDKAKSMKEFLLSTNEANKSMWLDSYIQLEELLDKALNETDDEKLLRSLVDPLVTTIMRDVNKRDKTEYHKANLLLTQLLTLIQGGQSNTFSDQFYDKIGKKEEREKMYKALFDIVRCRDSMAKFESLYNAYMTNPELLEAAEKEAEKKKAEVLKKAEVDEFEKQIEDAKTVSEVYDIVLKMLKDHPDAVDSINDAIKNKIAKGNKIVEQFNDNQKFVKKFAESLDSVEIDYAGVPGNKISENYKTALKFLLVESGRNSKSIDEITKSLYDNIESLNDNEKLKELLTKHLSILKVPDYGIDKFLNSKKAVVPILKSLVTATLNKKIKDEYAANTMTILDYEEIEQIKEFVDSLLSVKKIKNITPEYNTTAEKIGIDSTTVTPTNPKPEKLEGFGSEGLGGLGKSGYENELLDIKQGEDEHNEKSYNYWFPAIPLFALSERKEPNYNTVRNTQYGMFNELAKMLEERYDAFEFIDKHPNAVTQGTEIFFAVDKNLPETEYEYNGQKLKAKQVLICIKNTEGKSINGYQVIGTLTRNDEACKKFPGMKKMLDYVLEGAEKSSEEFFVSDKTRKVQEVKPGLVEIDKDNEISLSSVLEGTTGTHLFGYADASGDLQWNEKSITPVKTDGLKPGAVYILVPNANGLYVPMRLHTKHYNDNTGESCPVRDAKIKDVYNDMLDLLDKPIGNAQEENDLNDRFNHLYGDLNSLISIKAYGIHINYVQEPSSGKHKMYLSKTELDEDGNVIYEEKNGLRYPKKTTTKSIFSTTRNALTELEKIVKGYNVSYQVNKNDVLSGMKTPLEDDIMYTNIVKGGAEHTKGSYVIIGLDKEDLDSNVQINTPTQQLSNEFIFSIGKRKYILYRDVNKIKRIAADGSLSRVEGTEEMFARAFITPNPNATKRNITIKGEDICILKDSKGIIVWEGLKDPQRISIFGKEENAEVMYNHIKALYENSLFGYILSEKKDIVESISGSNLIEKTIKFLTDKDFIYALQDAWITNNHMNFKYIKDIGTRFDAITKSQLDLGKILEEITTGLTGQVVGRVCLELKKIGIEIDGKLNPNEKISAYTHIWAKAVAKNNPKLWEHIKKTLETTDVWKKYLSLAETDPSLSNLKSDSDALASKVISEYSYLLTKDGAEINIMKGARESKTLLENIKEFLDSFWKSVAEHVFKINPNKIKDWKDVANRVLYDFYNITDLRDPVNTTTSSSERKDGDEVITSIENKNGAVTIKFANYHKTKAGKLGKAKKSGVEISKDDIENIIVLDSLGPTLDTTNGARILEVRIDESTGKFALTIKFKGDSNTYEVQGNSLEALEKKITNVINETQTDVNEIFDKFRQQPEKTTNNNPTQPEDNVQASTLSDGESDRDFSIVKENDSKEKLIDIDKEIQKLRTMIPGLVRDEAIAIINHLWSVGDKGVVAQGAFSRGLIALSTKARRGTAYHEAFHAVFNTCLDENEKELIIQEAKDTYDAVTSADAVECLADAFRDYLIEYDDMSLSKRIINFFKDLWNMITNQKQVSSYSIKLFNRIRTGYYKKSEYKYKSLKQTRHDELSRMGFNDNEIDSIQHYRTGFSSRDYDTQIAILESGFTEEDFDMLPEDVRENFIACI